ncbi:MAG: peptidoglycan-binding domain-containing protein, partial [Leptolyngbyaceae bacterium]|nr:peptidoglycan-binding domain-containing protein [Leptolyngbyaceae bacterium]
MKTLIGRQSSCCSHSSMKFPKHPTREKLNGVRGIVWKVLQVSLLAPVLACGVLLSVERIAEAQILGSGSVNVLRLGDRGSAVTSLQQRLNELGYSVSSDGVYGSETE